MTWALLSTVLELSAKGTLVVLLLLAVRVLLGRRLSARARFALWTLVAVRLLMPWAPESPWSVQRSADLVARAPLPGLDPTLAGAFLELGPTAVVPLAPEASPWDWRVILAVAWLVGVAALLLRVAAAWLQSRQQVREALPVDDPRILGIYRQCLEVLGLQRPVPLRRSARVSGAEVRGLVRPVILVPASGFADLDDDRMRNVLLHELAHVRRRDPLWQLSAFTLVSVHWFNPLLWIAFRFFRDDLEMACDAEVLSRLEAGARSGYGHTLLDLGARTPGPIAAACFAGEKRQRLIRRVHMIARFKPSTLVGSVAVTLFAGLLAVLAWTDLPLGPLGAEEQRIRELSPTEIAAVFADRLGAKTDEDPGAVAAELSRIWKANHDQAEEIKAAIAREADLAMARENPELAGVLAKMIAVLAEEDGLEPPVLSDDERRMQATVQLLRQAGTRLYERFHVDGAEQIADPVTETRWSECPTVSVQVLNREHFGGNAGKLPAYDAWGHELEYCLAPGSEKDPATRFGVRSPGMDGTFSPGPYAIGGFDLAEAHRDLVWVDGYFATWPEAPSGS